MLERRLGGCASRLSAMSVGRPAVVLRRGGAGGRPCVMAEARRPPALSCPGTGTRRPRPRGARDASARPSCALRCVRSVTKLAASRRLDLPYPRLPRATLRPVARPPLASWRIATATGAGRLCGARRERPGGVPRRRRRGAPSAAARRASRSTTGPRAGDVDRCRSLRRPVTRPRAPAPARRRVGVRPRARPATVAATVGGGGVVEKRALAPGWSRGFAVVLARQPQRRGDGRRRRALDSVCGVFSMIGVGGAAARRGSLAAQCDAQRGRAELRSPSAPSAEAQRAAHRPSPLVPRERQHRGFTAQLRDASALRQRDGIDAMPRRPVGADPQRGVGEPAPRRRARSRGAAKPAVSTTSHGSPQPQTVRREMKAGARGDTPPPAASAARAWRCDEAARFEICDANVATIRTTKRSRPRARMPRRRCRRERKAKSSLRRCRFLGGGYEQLREDGRLYFEHSPQPSRPRSPTALALAGAVVHGSSGAPAAGQRPLCRAVAGAAAASSPRRAPAGGAAAACLRAVLQRPRAHRRAEGGPSRAHGRGGSGGGMPPADSRRAAVKAGLSPLSSDAAASLLLGPRARALVSRRRAAGCRQPAGSVTPQLLVASHHPWAPRCR